MYLNEQAILCEAEYLSHLKCIAVIKMELSIKHFELEVNYKYVSYIMCGFQSTLFPRQMEYVELQTYLQYLIFDVLYCIRNSIINFPHHAVVLLEHNYCLVLLFFNKNTYVHCSTSKALLI